MSDPRTICIYNPDPDFPLHQPFEQLPNVLIQGRLERWSELREWIKRTHTDLIVVNLDAENALDTVGRIMLTSPACSVIGVSTRTDPTTIIKAMRAGCTQFVPWPVDMADLQAATDRIVATRQASFGDSTRICVVGSSGGVGATTVACNLVIELAQIIDHRCALIDMNLELGDVACAFDCRPDHSVASVCHEGADVDTMMMNKAFHELPCGVSVLARPESLEQAHRVTPQGIADMLTIASQMFPFVVLDQPRSFSSLSAPALRDADRVLIVTQLSVSSIRNATRIYECLCQMGTHEESIEIVLNRCKADFAKITPDDVEAHFGKTLFGMIPNDYRRVQSALDRGHPILATEANSPARLAIQEMARKLTTQLSPDDQIITPGGFLSRFWNRAPAHKHVHKPVGEKTTLD